MKEALGPKELQVLTHRNFPVEEAEYLYERGLVKEALGQKEEAKADFEKAKELDPDVGK